MPGPMDTDSDETMMTYPSVMKDLVVMSIPAKITDRYKPSQSDFPSNYPGYDNPSGKRTTTLAHQAYMNPNGSNLSNVTWMPSEARASHIKYMQQREDYRRVTGKKPGARHTPEALDAMMATDDWHTSLSADEHYEANVCGFRTRLVGRSEGQTFRCESLVRSDSGSVVQSLDKDREEKKKKKRIVVEEELAEGSKRIRPDREEIGEILTHRLQLAHDLWMHCNGGQSRNSTSQTSTRFVLSDNSGDPGARGKILVDLKVDDLQDTMATLQQLLGFCKCLEDTDTEALLLGISEEDLEEKDTEMKGARDPDTLLDTVLAS